MFAEPLAKWLVAQKKSDEENGGSTLRAVLGQIRSSGTPTANSGRATAGTVPRPHGGKQLGVPHFGDARSVNLPSLQQSWKVTARSWKTTLLLGKPTGPLP